MGRKGLGKGVGSLFGDVSIDDIAPSPADNSEKILEIEWSKIEPNKNQPRKNFDMEKLEILAESIKEHGIIQPIVVTKISDNRYQIVAGERRWRAAKIAGLDTIKAIVKEYSMETVSEIALIENLQREDLNPIEEAQGYNTLMKKYNFTQEKISKRIGKSRSAIANSLRLLSLDDEIKEYLTSGEITSGHARAILALSDGDMRHKLAEKIVAEGLNVRQAEKWVKDLQEEKPKPVKEKSNVDAELEKIQTKMAASLGTRVKIMPGAKKGKIEIEYYGNEDLERLMDILISE